MTSERRVGYPAAPTPLEQTGASQSDGTPAFNLASQRADAIYQAGRDLVAGDQHNELSLKVAPMRRRARNVMRSGFSLIFGGFVVAVVGLALFAGSIMDGFRDPEAAPNLTGWAIAGVGSATIVLGVLLVIVSLFMKRGMRQKGDDDCS